MSAPNAAIAATRKRNGLFLSRYIFDLPQPCPGSPPRLTTPPPCQRLACSRSCFVGRDYCQPEQHAPVPSRYGPPPQSGQRQSRDVAERVRRLKFPLRRPPRSPAFLLITADCRNHNKATHNKRRLSSEWHAMIPEHTWIVNAEFLLLNTRAARWISAATAPLWQRVSARSALRGGPARGIRWRPRLCFANGGTECRSSRGRRGDAGCRG